jgi:hypothetical protein
MNTKIFAFFFICLFAMSCTKKKLNKKDYLQYIENEDNGLRASRIMGDVKYTLQYKPIDYVLLKENNSNAQQTAVDLKGMQYYTLSYSLVKNDKDILRYDLSEENEYYQRVNYFSYGLQNDLYLVDGSDTLLCKLFNYVRSYGLSPRVDVVIGFNTTPKKAIEEKQLVLEDKMFNGGIIKLKVTKKDLENIPELIEK